MVRAIGCLESYVYSRGCPRRPYSPSFGHSAGGASFETTYNGAPFDLRSQSESGARRSTSRTRVARRAEQLDGSQRLANRFLQLIRYSPLWVGSLVLPLSYLPAQIGDFERDENR